MDRPPRELVPRLLEVGASEWLCPEKTLEDRHKGEISYLDGPTLGLHGRQASRRGRRDCHQQNTMSP